MPVADAAFRIRLYCARTEILGHPAGGETSALLERLFYRLGIEILHDDIAVHEPERLLPDPCLQRTQNAAGAKNLIFTGNGDFYAFCRISLILLYEILNLIRKIMGVDRYVLNTPRY